MAYVFCSGPKQPHGEIFMPKGQAIAGYSIGILCIDTWYPLVPGNVVNACTYNFPVLFKILRGVSVEQIMSGDPALLDLLIKGGRELIEQGVRAIVGACGSFANYQKEAAAVFEVPTFMSSMLQVPLILRSLRPSQKLGVVAASAAALTPKVFSQCGITDPSRLVITEAKGLPEFDKLLNCAGRFDSHKMEQEMIELTRGCAKNNPEIAAILLQCSDMPPYAWAIQNAMKLPVFDMTTLIDWLHSAVVRKPFGGFI